MTATQKKVLLVEDERAQREALSGYLGEQGFQVDAFPCGEDALDALRQRSYALMITDLRLPGMDGLCVVRRARDLDEELGVLLITAFASVDSAIEALRVGAHDYLLKPLILEEVGCKVRKLMEQRELARENVRLRRVLRGHDKKRELVAESPAMRQTLAWIQRAASSLANVLVTGETGTGKEVVARTIHQMGEQADQPFLPVNLAAVPTGLLESELFGHERGAFTGADRKREGILRTAGSGTVFLDEIAELPMELQAKLLRALEASEIRPLGSDRAVPIEARILAATHRDPQAMVAEGTFREDLFYRLNVLHIHLPPLRQRVEDIPPLVRNLLERQAKRSGVAAPVVTAEAMRCLCSHTWRGNARELSNVLERALILADDGRIDLEQLPGDVVRATGESLQLSEAIEGFERGHIARVLRLCNGNREKAARIMGISQATLYRRLERLRCGSGNATDAGANVTLSDLRVG